MAIKLAGIRTEKTSDLKIENQSSIDLPKGTEENIRKIFAHLPSEHQRGLERIRLVDFINNPQLKNSPVSIKGVILSTTEHLLAALRGAGVDNCFLEIDNLEIPIMDGSSENFLELIEQAGIVEQNAPRHFLKIKEKVAFEQGDRKMSVEPCENYEIECLIDFQHPFINRQTFNFTLSNGSFGREIASARTFGFTHEIEMLRKANLTLGGSLENAIVLTPDGMLNENPLRFRDEFVRHKILDIVGDFALLGMPILGKIKAEKSGHSVHASLMSKLLKNEKAWEITEAVKTHHV